jgi:mRNA interferase YafQ
MRQVIWDEGFKRSVKRQTKHKPELKVKIKAIIQNLSEDPFEASLKTHKLKGDLKGPWACTVEYDCRIVFRFQKLKDESVEAILLIDIGNHDDVC